MWPVSGWRHDAQGSFHRAARGGSDAVRARLPRRRAGGHRWTRLQEPVVVVAGYLLDRDAICGYSSQAESAAGRTRPVALKGTVGGAGGLCNMHVSLYACT